MKDLFERLKAEPPVNTFIREPLKSTDSSEKEQQPGKLSPRRESMPPPSSPVIFRAVKANKGRSLSPPKITKLSQTTKPFKVLIERKKLDELLNKTGSLKSIAIEMKDVSSTTKAQNDKDPKSPSLQKTDKSPKNMPNSKSTEPKSDMEVVFKSPKKMFTPQKKSTPTKAQQKEFATALPETNTFVQLAAIQQQLPKVKRCLVRVRREDLLKVRNQSPKPKPSGSRSPQKSPKDGTKPKNNQKRKSTETSGKESPRKRGRPSKSGFFIKLSASMVDFTEKTDEKKTKNKKDTQIAKKPNKTSSASKEIHKSTKPTKLSRTKLIKAFGKRFFQSHVKIEKCNHPLMVIFESNARARKEQANHSKCKNLSVSFRDQVEIFGSSDDDSDYEDEVHQSKKSSVTTASCSVGSNAKAADVTLPLMPARLKKIENGKVVDDILLDPSLFINPEDVAECAAISSTPYTPGRKKRDKKFFSPLKGDETPSLRKEQLKLANEKIPPSVLRSVNVDDLDDDDDDCEYIVPTEIPERRASRTNSSNTADSSGSFASAIDIPVVNKNIASENEASATSVYADTEVKETVKEGAKRAKKEEDSDMPAVGSESIRIQVTPSPTSQSSITAALSEKPNNISPPSPVAQSPIPGATSPVPGTSSPTHDDSTRANPDSTSPTHDASTPTPEMNVSSTAAGATSPAPGDSSTESHVSSSAPNASSPAPGKSSPAPGESSPAPGESTPEPDVSSTKLNSNNISEVEAVDEDLSATEKPTPSPKYNLDTNNLEDQIPIPKNNLDAAEKSKAQSESDVTLDLFVDVDPEENNSKGLSLFPDSEEDQDILDCLLKERIDEIAQDDDVTNTSDGDAPVNKGSNTEELEDILSVSNIGLESD